MFIIFMGNFEGGMCLKFLDHLPDETSSANLSKFLEEISDLNVHRFIAVSNSILCSFDLPTMKKNKLRKECSSWMLSFLEFWDRSVEKLTLKRINEEHKRKLSLKSRVFNFSSFQIPSKDAHALMNSKNTVFKFKIPLKRLKSRIRTESINYAEKFRK